MIPTLAFQGIYSDIYFVNDHTNPPSHKRNTACALKHHITYVLAFNLAFSLTSYQAFAWFVSDILSIWHSIKHSMTSCARNWGPPAPTEIWLSSGIWRSRLRSGSAHWDLELVVEVRQCPLRCEASSWSGGGGGGGQSGEGHIFVVLSFFHIECQWGMLPSFR